MKKQIKDFAINMLLAAGSILIAFCFLEGILRLVIERPQTYIVQGLNKDGQSSDEKIISYKEAYGLSYKTSSGYRLKKNSILKIYSHKFSKRDIEVRTNSLGYRSEEIGKKKKDDYRILVLGDSITIEVSAPLEETYPEIIEATLKKSTPKELKNKNINVINAGIGGVDLENELAILMETGLSVKPDVVLVGLYLNDAAASSGVKAIQLPELFKKSYLMSFLANRLEIIQKIFEFDSVSGSETVPLEEEREKFIKENIINDESWGYSQGGLNSKIRECFFDWGYAWSDDFWDRIEKNLSIMKEVGNDNDFELVVVLFPVGYQVQSFVQDFRPQEKFNALMGKLKIRHLDLLPALREKYLKDQVTVYWDSCHYRPQGLKFIGQKIAEFLFPE